jgi:large subunit ribosomal protein L25
MKIAATTRKLQGTGASRRLRITGTTPGIVYGGTAAVQMIELNHNDLYHALKKEAFHASILDLEIDGKPQKALLRDYQMHPFKQLVLHIDFQRVDADRPIHMKVPLHFVGAENSPAVKLSKGMVNHPMNELNVSCLPADLPEFITVDLSEMVAGKSLHVSDLKLPKGVTAVIHGGAADPVVASAVLPGGKKEEAEEAPAAAAAAAPAAAGGKAAAAAPAAAAAKAPAKK